MKPITNPLIIVPTYNECENIKELIDTIDREIAGRSVSMLVVDSASPDGTADVVREIQKSHANVFLFQQTAKLGLGRAYLDGMHWAFERDYDCMITMDADFSHHPRYLNPMLEAAQSLDLVIGSRYAPGGALENWPWHRKLLSRFANWYARTLTALPFHDLTAGFQCFRRDTLKKILRYNIHTDGYAFLVELKFLSILQGAKCGEIPIIFSDRTKGDSKISKRVVLESMAFVLSRSLQRNRIRAALKKTRLRQERHPTRGTVSVP